MATYNGNNVYLNWDGVNISGYFTEQIDVQASNNTVDITAGAGVTGIQRGNGLDDRTMSFSVVYDDADLSGYVGKLKQGTIGTLIYGPEGSGTGKPKFSGSMVLQQVSGPNPGIEKPKVMFELSFEQADIPTHTIENGDTF